MPQSCEPLEKLVIRFEGSMDSAKCAKIETEVRTAVDAPGTPVVFDLDGVDFISSAFLRLCIYGQQQAADHGFQIVNVAPYVKRVFKIAGLDAMLKAE
ncbi:MAG: STAS domain-containing protein [Thermoguttaceae bacterium]|jgi:anti-anti-sigma factor